MEGYQIQNILEMLIMSGATISVVWIAARVFIHRKRVSGTADPKLIEAVDRLRESVDGMRDDLADVSERLDFTERVLGQIAEGRQRELPGA